MPKIIKNISAEVRPRHQQHKVVPQLWEVRPLGSWFGFFTFMLFMLSFSSASAATLQKPPNNLGLVGYWSMNEGTSTTAGDSSGQGNTGTLNNGPTWTSGKLGGGLSFDGTDDYVIASQASTGLTQLAVSFWVNPDVFPAGQTGIFQWADVLNSPNPFILLTMGTGGTSQLYVDGDYRVTTTLPNTSWSHVVITLNTSNLWTLYVNGAVVGTYQDDATHAYQGAVSIYLGNGYAEYFDGKIDEPRIYNRALSATEVSRLHQSGLAKLNSSQNSKVTNGLVGLWSFDGADMSGTTAFDRSGQGNNGTLMSGPTRTIGKVGQGLAFDGTDDYINGGNILNFTSSDFSISHWMKLDSLSTNEVGQGPVPIFKGPYQVDGYYSQINASGGITFVTNQSGASQGTASVSGVIGTTNWHHIVYARSGSRVYIYVDGLDKTGTAAIHVNPALSSNNFLIGYYNNGGSIYMNGKIDDVRAYNRTLTQAEITQLYNTGGSKLNSSQNNIPGSTLQSGLVGLWSFNGPDMSGVTAYDRSGNANNGTLTNSPTRAIGKVGQGMSFDGVNDYVDVPYTNLDFERTDPFSFSVWAKWEDVVPAGGAQSFIGRYTGGIRGTLFFECKNAITNYCYANSVGLALGSASNNALTVSTAAGSFLPNIWTHIAVTYDGSSSGSGIKIYKDGISMPVTTLYSALSATIKSGNNWRIGDDYTNDWMKGNIDEVRIYSRALSANEIKQLYLLGR